MFKRQNAAIVVLLLTLAFTTNVYAQTTDELTAMYGVHLKSSCSQNVIDILDAHYKAEKQAYAYNNVVASKVNADATVDEAYKTLMTCSKNLLASYGKDYSDILQQESDYVQVLKIYTFYKEATKTVSVNSLSFNDVPTKEEYEQAYNEYKAYKGSKEIGTISNNKAPIRYYTNVQMMPDYTKYTTDTVTDVTALFNGEVTSASNNTIVITCPDNVSVTYKKLLFVDVDIGDEVTQGQKIGMTGDILFVGLTINDKHYNLSRVCKR